MNLLKTHALWIFCLGILISFPLSAQETTFSGSLTTQAGAGLPNTHYNKGKFLLGTTVFDGIIKSYINESMVYVNGKLIHDSLGAQSSNGREALVSEDGTFAVKLKEAYIDYNNQWWALRAGRQIAAWGKADGIQIADILCPQDESTIIASDYKESRIGIDALRFSLIGNSMQADAYWIPLFTPSTLPFAKGNPLRAVVFPAENNGIPIISPERYNDLELPEKKLENSEYALRLSGYFSAFDLSLYGFYGWDDMPFITYKPELNDYDDEIEKIFLSAKYKRMMMVAADAAIPVGDFVLRLEGAFFPDRFMQTSPEYQNAQLLAGKEVKEAEKHHQALALAGFDWTPSGGWTITAQYVADYICGSEKSIDDIERRRFQQQATLSIEKSLLNETLTISAQGLVDMRDFSSASEFSAEYSLSDSIKLSVIGNIFLEGPDNKKGMYGNYHDLSCATVKAKISF